METPVTVLSIALQLSAAILALTNLRASGKRLAWILISSAVLLMAGGRILPLFTSPGDINLFSSNPFGFLELLISALMLAGVILIAPFFTSSSRTDRAHSERKYATIIRTAMDAFWVADKNGRLLEVNDTSCEMLGYSRQELLGMSIQSIEAEENSAEVNRHIQRIVRIGRDTFETKHRRKDGSVIFVDLNVSFTNIDGGLLYVFIRDITERKQAERALRESEEKYRTLVDNMQDAVYRSDLDGNLIFASPSVARLLGCPSTESMIGRNISKDFYYHPEEREKLLSILEEKGRVTYYEVTLKRIDNGDPVIVLTNSQFYRDREGKIIGVEGVYHDITERKRAGEALKESEKKYRSVIENIQDVFYRSDLNGLLIMGSPSGATMFGYDSIDEMIGMSLDSCWIHPQDRQQLIAQIRANGEVRDYEAVLKKKDGTSFNASFNAHFYHDDKGNVLGTEGIIHDITRRKRAEEALKAAHADLEKTVEVRTTELRQAYDKLIREVEERKAAEDALRLSKDQLNLITNNMLDLVSIFSRDHTYLYASPSHKTLLGYEPEDLVGKPLSEFLHPEEGDKVGATMDLVFSSGVTGHVVTQFRNADGHYQWLESFGSLLHDDACEVIGMISSSRDVTDRQLLETKLKLSERRFRGIFENSPVALFELDLSELQAVIEEVRNSGVDDIKGLFRKNKEAAERCLSSIRIINVNSTARNIFNIDEKVEFLESLKEYPAILQQCTDSFREGLLAFLRGEHVFDDEISIEIGNGRTMHLSFRVSLAPGAEGNWSRAIASVENITRFKELERDLMLARDSAEKANRAKSEFLANMSHELRTPLNAIIGFSQIIDMQIQDRSLEKLAEYLGYIKTGGEHLLEMVNDILDLSKIEAGKIELDFTEFSLSDVLISIPTHVKSLAMKKGLRVHLDIDPDLGTIRGDEVRIKQIIYNLLSNAIKFTESGKRIGIEAHQQGHTAVITVWDEGIGIAAQNLHRIFRPFEQVGAASKDAQGTGLGLAITMRLVELHGGGIDVESAPGEGSRFTITLPGISQNGAASGKGKPSPERPRREHIASARRILVVDDKEMNLRLLEEFLKGTGFIVETACSGENAVDLVNRGNYDLILMDIKMPGMGGIEAMKAIRSMKRDNMKIYAFTASAMKGSEEGFLEMGFDDYVSKPIDLSGLMAKIKKTLDEQ